MKKQKKIIRIRLLLSKISRQWLISLIIFLVFSAVISSSVYFTYTTYSDLTDSAISRRQAVSSLSASVIKEKLDRIIAIGQTHTHNKEFQSILEAGNWAEALNSEAHVLTEVSFIERANLFSVDGRLMSTYPYDASIASFYGVDFSYRDYFKKLQKTWEPYAGEIIMPLVPIGHPIVLVLIPIKTSQDKVIGVLALNLNIDFVKEWSKEVDAGKSGYIYVVDSKGFLIAHPTLLPSREIIDYSAMPAVKKVKNGESGVEISYNETIKKEEISSYSPVHGYGWGVIVVQPSSIAFEVRNMTVRIMITIELMIAVILAIGTFVLLRDRSKFQAQIDREEILLNSIGDSVIAIDRDWRITLWNSSAKHLSGWSKEEVLGKPLLNYIKLLRETDRGENIQFIEDIMNTGQISDIDYPAILINKDGKDVAINSSVAPIMNEDKEVTGVVIVMRDVTKKREASMLHSDFAYASHQLRTPVTEALWSLEAVMGENNPQLIKKNASIAHDSIQSVRKLSEELITVSEIDQGEIYVDVTEVKLLSLMDEVLEEVSEKAGERAIKLEVSAISSSDILHTDRKLLKQILVELLDNAITYSPKKSEVTCNIKNNGNEFLFEIKDSGIGIDAEHQPLVFTKFFRGSNFSTSEIAGAGLGLYITRGYVKLLNGKIWFKSEKKKGTTFSVSIPTLVKDKK